MILRLTKKSSVRSCFDCFQPAMANDSLGKKPPQRKGPGVGVFITPLSEHKLLVALLVLTIVITSSVNLWLPRLLGQMIDAAAQPETLKQRAVTYLAISVAGFVFLGLQGVIATIISERIGRDLRNSLIKKLAGQSYQFVTSQTVPKLLTNVTSDVDAIRGFFNQGITIVLSSLILIVGGAIMLLITQWTLALIVLAMVPVVFIWFGYSFGRIGKIFFLAQGALDRLNTIITESLLGSAVIRVLAAQNVEIIKFASANENAQSVNLQIVKMFASLIPGIMFISNMVVLAIVGVGGNQVIAGTLSLGTLTAFYNYVSVFIMPLLMVGFVSSQFVRAATTYTRLQDVINAPLPKPAGTLPFPSIPTLEFKKAHLKYGERNILCDVNLKIQSGQRVAILGPTGAGKSQLFELLANMIPPTSGQILLNDQPLSEYDQEDFAQSVRFVFQESLVFNATVRENLAFGKAVTDDLIFSVLTVAEMDDAVRNMPAGLDTMLNEAGSNLSGGQRQRLMLARALLSNPKVLCLDDFTSRVDIKTELKIMKNLAESYPGLTLIVIAQKIESIKDFDHIIVLMDGDVLAQGTHEELLRSSFDYQQLSKSQQSIES